MSFKSLNISMVNILKRDSYYVHVDALCNKLQYVSLKLLTT